MRLAVAAVCAVWLMLPFQQTFRTGVDAVRVDVAVIDGHRAVAGLTAADFELRDSGVLQHVESVAMADVPLGIMLALDGSGSVSGLPLVNLKQAASAVAGLLRPGDHAALLTFAQGVDLMCEWTADRQQLVAAIERTRAGGGTALYDAGYAALTMKDPQGGRSLVIVFSDGDDTASWLSGQQVIEVARQSDAVIYGVGLPGDPGETSGYLVDVRSGLQRGIPPVLPSALTKPFLAALAEETGGRYINAERSEGLSDAFTGIVNEFRSRYLLTYSPAGVDTAGWHPIQVRAHARGRVTARRGYLR